MSAVGGNRTLASGTKAGTIEQCSRNVSHRLRLCFLLAQHPAAHEASSTTTGRDALFYGQRNGTTEALADVAAGKPLKLYSHIFGGRIESIHTPGLLDCNPLSRHSTQGGILFAPLPDADWQEGQAYTDDQNRAASAARSFARQYNRTMFEARRAELLRACPLARLGD